MVGWTHTHPDSPDTRPSLVPRRYQRVFVLVRTTFSIQASFGSFSSILGPGGLDSIGASIGGGAGSGGKAADADSFKLEELEDIMNAQPGDLPDPGSIFAT